MSYLSKNPFFNSPFDFDTNKEDSIMRSDISISNDTYTIEIELPGMKKENIGLDYENGYLKVSAIREEEIDETTSYVRKERFYGEYNRTFYIGDVKEEEIHAEYQNGVLVIHFPKESKIESKQIHIN